VGDALDELDGRGRVRRRGVFRARAAEEPARRGRLGRVGRRDADFYAVIREGANRSRFGLFLDESIARVEFSKHKQRDCVKTVE
jgi:hypothetical protein